MKSNLSDGFVAPTRGVQMLAVRPEGMQEL